MNKTILYFIIGILMVSLASATQSIEQDGVIITSDKEYYYCQNVISPDGCLINTMITVENNRVSAINGLFEFDSNKDIVIRDYISQGQQIALDKTEGKNIISLNRKLIGADDIEYINVNFWTKESGKFNFSVEFAGITVKLDPIFNVTRNVTTPSYHLLNGTNNTISDSDYLNLINITAGLNDESDATFYETYNYPNASAIYRFEEGSGLTALDSSGRDNHGTITGATYFNSNGELGTGNYALDFDGLNDRILFSDDNNQFQFGDSVTDTPFTLMIWANITDVTTFRFLYKYQVNKEFIWGFTAGDDMLIWLQDDSTSGYLRGDSLTTKTALQNEWHHFATTYNGNMSDEGIQHYIDGSPISMEYLGSGSYTAMEDTGEDVWMAWGTSYSDGALDELYVFHEALDSYAIEDIYNKGLNISTRSIKATFDITLNPILDYYLRVRKTTTGIDDLVVYLYENSTDINSTVKTEHTVTTGWDSVRLNSSMIKADHQAVFRFFTSEYSEISEVHLIEQINDSTAPTIQDCAVNNTYLDCNDWVRLSCNVTDDIGLDHVMFSWNDTSSHTEEVDRLIDTDIYYKDLQYTASTTNKTYIFENSTATDLVEQTTESILNIEYYYACAEDSDAPAVALNEPSDDTTTNETSISFNCSATDFTGLDNATLYHNLSGTFESIETKAMSGLSDSESFIDTIGHNNSIVWNCEVCDTLGQCGFADANYTLNVLQTFPPPPDVGVSITLLSPANNSQDADGIVEFQYSVNKTGYSASLYINDTLINTMDADIGFNQFAVQYFTSNQTIEWHATLNASEIESETWILILNLTNLPTEEEDYLVRGTCPTQSIEQLLFIIFMTIIIISLIAGGYAIKNGAVGTIGSIMYLVLSLFIYACQLYLAFLMSLSALALIVYFIYRGSSGFK